MSTLQPSIQTERIACEICLGEVPQSVAFVPEAADYVAHFCGLQCYEQLSRRTLSYVEADARGGLRGKA